jgi:hypothetical protein
MEVYFMVHFFPAKSLICFGPPRLGAHRNSANLLTSSRHARASRNAQRAEVGHTNGTSLSLSLYLTGSCGTGATSSIACRHLGLAFFGPFNG